MSNQIFPVYEKLRNNIAKVIVGKDETADLLIITLLCRGHMLIEDVPGTGKTMIVKALAASIDADCKRIQFTPDVLPSDLSGVNFFNMKNSEFEFIKGPVFSNIVIADEINRATPKTQSGLLECMEERQVSVDGTTYKLAEPFMVVATQNPVENTGVFPLPEAQLDRFLIKASMQYPTAEESAEILTRFGQSNPLDELTPAVSREEILKAQDELKQIFIHPDIIKYIVQINDETRNYESVILGSSPRGALALMNVSKGFAAISGRDYVIPDDVKRSARAVLSHRLMLTNTARIKKNAAESIIDDILSNTPVPTETALER